MQMIILLIFLAIAAWIIFTFIRDYAAATGSTWERLLAAGKDSATKLWARFTMLLASLSGGLIYLADYLNQPQLDGPIKTILSPNVVPFYLVAVAVITIWARNRTKPAG